MRPFALALALSLPALAASPTKASAHADAANKAFAAAMLKGDAAAVADMYTEDAHLLFFDGKTYKGRKELLDLFTGYFKDNKVKSMTLTSEEAHMMGNAVLDIGRYEMVTLGKDGKESASKGRFMDVLKKGKDGKWRLWRDCPLSN
jgi:uncharacterized protein (TIGR02246 family)